MQDEKTHQAGPLLTLRYAVGRQLAPSLRPKGLSPLNLCLAVLIIVAVAVAVLETEPTISNGRTAIFRALEIGFAGLFAAEYALRFWTAVDDPDLGGGWRARFRWAISPWALIDLLAFLPVFLTGFSPSYLLRLVRLIRILRLAKLGRFSTAWALLAGAITSRKYELYLTAFAAAFTLLVSATLLFLVEGPLQPEKFGSIPRALWWSAITLTTIGYGDVYPVSPLGKALTGITAVIGVGLIATPAGIIAAALSDAIQRQRKRDL